MCKISLKIVKNESYQIVTNIRNCNLPYFMSILKTLAQNYCKNLSYKTILIKKM
jgi:hypothetical protein